MSPEPPPLATLDEAAAWLDPPVTRRQLGSLVGALRIAPAGRRSQGRGRPAATYEMEQLIRLHAAVTPWLVAGEAPPPVSAPAGRKPAMTRSAGDTRGLRPWTGDLRRLIVPLDPSAHSRSAAPGGPPGLSRPREEPGRPGRARPTTGRKPPIPIVQRRAARPRQADPATTKGGKSSLILAKHPAEPGTCVLTRVRAHPGDPWDLRIDHADPRIWIAEPLMDDIADGWQTGHVSYQCPHQDRCARQEAGAQDRYLGDLVKIHGVNRTVVYRVGRRLPGHYLGAATCEAVYEAEWPD